MQTQHLIKLLRIANYYLPWIEDRYNYLVGEANRVELQIKDSKVVLQNLEANSKYYSSYCQIEMNRFNQLCKEKGKQEALVRYFKNNNEEYVKIINTVEEKVRATLSNRKKLLEFAAFSLIKSIRQNPAKYYYVMQLDVSPITDYRISYYNPYYMCGQQPQQQQIHSKDYSNEVVAMLSEDAARLIDKLALDLVNQILSDYADSTSSSSPPSISFDKQDFKTLPGFTTV